MNSLSSYFYKTEQAGEQKYAYQGLVRHNRGVSAVLTDDQGRVITADIMTLKHLFGAYAGQEPLIDVKHPGFQAFLDAFRNIVYFENNKGPEEWRDSMLDKLTDVGLSSLDTGRIGQFDTQQQQVLLDHAYKNDAPPEDFVAVTTDGFAVSSNGPENVGEIASRSNGIDGYGTFQLSDGRHAAFDFPKYDM